MSTLPAARAVKRDHLTRILAEIIQLQPSRRATYARQHLGSSHPDLVRYFDSIPRNGLHRTILFVSLNPHSRETRFATAARIAGWHPVLVHQEAPRYVPEAHFDFHQRVENIIQLVLACWLFPGALVHGFVLRGDHAHLLTLTKHRPLILDIYDTGSGMTTLPSSIARDERAVLSKADGLTHRDLRIKYLQRLHGYSLPPHNVFIHDPLPETAPVAQANRPHDGEIHVVSVGWVSPGDSGILRVARALCQDRVHLHVYLNPFQTDPHYAACFHQLARESKYLHLEKPVYGQDYWSQLSLYDFGLSISEPFMFGESPESYTTDYLKGCGSSRISDYIAMNLGVISTPGLRFQHFWARHYAPCVVSGDAEFLAHPREVLAAALLHKQKRNLAAITVRGVARRLDQFYTQVATSKSKQLPVRAAM